MLKCFLVFNPFAAAAAIKRLGKTLNLRECRFNAALFSFVNTRCQARIRRAVLSILRSLLNTQRFLHGFKQVDRILAKYQVVEVEMLS